MNLQRRILIAAPLWWDRRALTFLSMPSCSVEWVNMNLVASQETIMSAASRLDEELEQLDVDQSTWMIVYGESMPLVLRTLHIRSDRRSALPRLLLIASGRSCGNLGREVTGLRMMKKLSHGLATKRYERVLRQTIDNELHETQARIAQAMLKEAGPLPLRKTVDWLLSWKGSRSEFDALNLTAFQLHGRDDKVFDAPPSSDATILGKAGHFMWFSHASSISNWIDAVAR